MVVLLFFPSLDVKTALIESTVVGTFPICKYREPIAGRRTAEIGVAFPDSILTVCEAMESL
jgi:hypothetical protein